MLGYFSLLDHPVIAVPPLPGNEVHPLLGQPGKPLVIGIPAIKHQNGSGLQGQFARHLDFSLPGRLDYGILGQISIVI